MSHEFRVIGELFVIWQNMEKYTEGKVIASKLKGWNFLSKTRLYVAALFTSSLVGSYGDVATTFT